MYASIAAAYLILSPNSTMIADPSETNVVERLVFDALKELNNRGADLNNVGDTIGCYRLYQGGLLMLKSMLGHHQSAQKVIDEGLKAAEKKPINERAFSLHTTITELRAIFKSAAPASPNKPVAPDANKGQTPVPSGELPKPAPLPAPSSFPDKPN